MSFYEEWHRQEKHQRSCARITTAATAAFAAAIAAAVTAAIVAGTAVITYNDAIAGCCSCYNCRIKYNSWSRIQVVTPIILNAHI